MRISILLIVTFGLAMLSRVFLERPFLRLKKKFG